MDDSVWVPTVFTKNRERLIKHEALIEFFNEMVAAYNLVRMHTLGQIRPQMA